MDEKLTPESAKHAEKLVNEFPYQGTISKAECRCITLAQLQRIGKFAEEQCTAWQDTGNGDALSWQALTMQHLIEWLIKPATEKNKCSFAELLSAADQKPLWVVCLWLGQRIADFLECIRVHAKLYDLGEDAPLWIAAFAERYHAPPEALDPCDAPMPRALQMAHGTLLALDSQATALRRLTVAFEVARTLRNQKLLNVAVSTADGAELITSALTAEEADMEEKKFVGAGIGAKADRENEFPVDVLQLGTALVLEEGEADSDQANQQLRAIFAAASWRQAVQKSKIQELGLVEALSAFTANQSAEISLAFCKECTDDVAQRIGLSFSSQLKRIVLDLSGCEKLTSDGMKYIVSKLPPTLEALHLRCWRCEKLDNAALAAIAEKMPPRVTTFELNCTGCRKVTEDVIEHLITKLPRELTSLSLSFPYAQLTDAGVAALALKLPSGLQSLTFDVSECAQVGNNGIKSLAQNFPPQLQVLKLSCRGCFSFNDAGVQALAKGLPPSLHSLSLFVKETGVSPEKMKTCNDLDAMRELAAKPACSCAIL